MQQVDPQRRRNSLQFPPAEQPDIVRAAQKDDFYKRLFNEQCYDLVGRIAGARYSMQRQREVRLFSELVYYLLNTLLGPRQTLGEEYCDILMVKPAGKYMIPPAKVDRGILLVWHILIPYLLSRMADRLSPLLGGVGGLVASLSRLPGVSLLSLALLPSVNLSSLNLLNLLPSLSLSGHVRAIASKLQRFHLAIFYFDGKFYDFSKRMANIYYIFNGREDQTRPKYHILGALILIQFAVSFLIYLKEKVGILSKLNLQIEDLSSNALTNTENDQRSMEVTEQGQQNQALRQSLSNANKCTLCLELRTNTTATLCGHLFCWDCITEWCNNKAECPLCRRPLTLQSLVCVYHYL